MNRSDSALTGSRFSTGWLWVWAALAVIAYSLPWVALPFTSLTLGGYDLAEWTSLQPSVRADSYLVTLLLRLPPVCIAVIAAAMVGKQRWSWAWWVGVIFVVLTAVAMLPPFEFFTEASFRSDPNYLQQMILSVVTLIAGGTGLMGLPLALPAAVIGAGASAAGWLQGYNLVRGFDLPAVIGMGGGLSVALFLVVLGIGLAGVIRKGRVHRTTPHTARVSA